MTIKIPVGVEVSGAQDAASKAAATVTQAAEQAGRKVNEAVGRAARSTARAAAEGAQPGGGGRSVAVRAIENAQGAINAAQRIVNAQKILEREFRRSFDRTTVERAAREFDRLARTSSRRLRQYGGLDDWLDRGAGDFIRPADANRQRRQILSRLGLASFGGGDGLTERSLVRAGRGTLQAALPFAVGGVPAAIMADSYQTAASSRGGLMSLGGAGALLRGLGIGTLALGAIKGVQAARASYASSEDEAVQYGQLTHALGDVTTNFGRLGDTVRTMTNDLGLGTRESASLARRYAVGAMLGAGDADSLGRELRTGIGMGRGMGVDPSQTVDTLASMRHFQVSRGDADNRRLAMMIGEAVAKAGGMTRAGDMIAAVEQFTQITARQSLVSPDVPAFLNFMTKVTGMGIPGLDPSGASALFAKADASVRAGGRMGEASQMALLAQAQRDMPGFNGLQLQQLLDGGLFGSAQTQFGENSMAYRNAAARGDVATQKRLLAMAQAGGGRTNLDRMMAALEPYRGTSGFAIAGGNAWGMSPTEFLAFDTALTRGGGVGALHGRLQKLGIDPSRIDARSISALAQTLGADRGAMLNQASRLEGLTGDSALSRDERSLLTRARASGDDERLRDAILRLSSTRDVSVNLGDEAQRSQVNLDREFQKFSLELLPIMTGMRSLLAAIVSRIAPDSEAAVAERSRVNAEAAKRREEANAGAQADGQRRAQELFADNYGLTLEARKRAASIAQTTLAPSPYDDVFERVGREEGVDPKLLKLIAAKESGLNPGAINKNANGSTDRGIMQTNSQYESSWGVSDPFDPVQSVRGGARALKEKGYGQKPLRDVLRRYNGAGDRAEAYADESMRAWQLVSAGPAEPTLPAGAGLGPRVAAATPSAQTFTHNITLRNDRGDLLADPVVQTSVGAAAPVSLFTP